MGEMINLGNRTLADAKQSLVKYSAMVEQRSANGKCVYLVPDSQLGWRLLPHARHPRWPYGTNEFGNRNSWPGSHRAAQAQHRVAIVGNSHVHGDEAPDEETWIYLAQERLGSSWRLHNLGITAYGTDQAILRFAEFADSQPLDIAVLALTTTEMYRNLNQCRAFMGEDREVPLFKPRYSFSPDGKPRFHPWPCKGGRPLAAELEDPEVLQQLQQIDAFYPSLSNQFFEVARRCHLPFPSIWQRLFDEAVEVTAQLCRMFCRLCEERGIRPAFMFLPVYWGSFPAGAEYDIYAAALKEAAPILDARAVFSPERRRLPRDVLHYRANHYTALSAGWVADFMAKGLRSLNSGDPGVNCLSKKM